MGTSYSEEGKGQSLPNGIHMVNICYVKQQHPVQGLSFYRWDPMSLTRPSWGLLGLRPSLCPQLGTEPVPSASHSNALVPNTLYTAGNFLFCVVSLVGLEFFLFFHLPLLVHHLLWSSVDPRNPLLKKQNKKTKNTKKPKLVIFFHPPVNTL